MFPKRRTCSLKQTEIAAPDAFGLVPDGKVTDKQELRNHRSVPFGTDFLLQAQTRHVKLSF